MKTINLIVVRHGKTYFNRYNKLQGWGNSPLTEAGIADAQRVGETLANVSFKAAYSKLTFYVPRHLYGDEFVQA